MSQGVAFPEPANGPEIPPTPPRESSTANSNRNPLRRALVSSSSSRQAIESAPTSTFALDDDDEEIFSDQAPPQGDLAPFFPNVEDIERELDDMERHSNDEEASEDRMAQSAWNPLLESSNSSMPSVVENFNDEYDPEFAEHAKAEFGPTMDRNIKKKRRKMTKKAFLTAQTIEDDKELDDMTLEELQELARARFAPAFHSLRNMDMIVADFEEQERLYALLQEDENEAKKATAREIENRLAELDNAAMCVSQFTEKLGRAQDLAVTLDQQSVAMDLIGNNITNLRTRVMQEQTIIEWETKLELRAERRRKIIGAYRKETQERGTNTIPILPEYEVLVQSDGTTLLQTQNVPSGTLQAKHLSSQSSGNRTLIPMTQSMIHAAITSGIFRMPENMASALPELGETETLNSLIAQGPTSATFSGAGSAEGSRELLSTSGIAPAKAIPRVSISEVVDVQVKPKSPNDHPKKSIGGTFKTASAVAKFKTRRSRSPTDEKYKAKAHVDRTVEKMEIKEQFHPAPKEGKVVLVYLTLKTEEIADVWERETSAFIHGTVQIGQLIIGKAFECNGYIAETRRNGSLIVFTLEANALRFAMEIHQALLEMDWLPALLKFRGCGTIKDPKNETRFLFRGLRAAVTIHCSELLSSGAANRHRLRTEPDPISKRLEFLGPDAQIPFQLAQFARGGETVVLTPIWEKVKGSIPVLAKEVHLKLSSDEVRASSFGGFVSEPVDSYHFLPLVQVFHYDLQGRRGVLGPMPREDTYVKGEEPSQPPGEGPKRDDASPKTPGAEKRGAFFPTLNVKPLRASVDQSVASFAVVTVPNFSAIIGLNCGWKLWDLFNAVLNKCLESVMKGKVFFNRGNRENPTAKFPTDFENGGFISQNFEETTLMFKTEALACQFALSVHEELRALDVPKELSEFNQKTYSENQWADHWGGMRVSIGIANAVPVIYNHRATGLYQYEGSGVLTARELAMASRAGETLVTSQIYEIIGTRGINKFDGYVVSCLNPNRTSKEAKVYAIHSKLLGARAEDLGMPNGDVMVKLMMNMNEIKSDQAEQGHPNARVLTKASLSVSKITDKFLVACRRLSTSYVHFDAIMKAVHHNLLSEKAAETFLTLLEQGSRQGLVKPEVLSDEARETLEGSADFEAQSSLSDTVKVKAKRRGSNPSVGPAMANGLLAAPNTKTPKKKALDAAPSLQKTSSTEALVSTSEAPPADTTWSGSGQASSTEQPDGEDSLASEAESVSQKPAEMVKSQSTTLARVPQIIPSVMTQIASTSVHHEMAKEAVEEYRIRAKQERDERKKELEERKVQLKKERKAEWKARQRAKAHALRDKIKAKLRDFFEVSGIDTRPEGALDVGSHSLVDKSVEDFLGELRDFKAAITPKAIVTPQRTPLAHSLSPAKQSTPSRATDEATSSSEESSSSSDSDRVHHVLTPPPDSPKGPPVRRLSLFSELKERLSHATHDVQRALEREQHIREGGLASVAAEASLVKEPGEPFENSAIEEAVNDPSSEVADVLLTEEQVEAKVRELEALAPEEPIIAPSDDESKTKVKVKPKKPRPPAAKRKMAKVVDAPSGLKPTVDEGSAEAGDGAAKAPDDSQPSATTVNIDNEKRIPKERTKPEPVSPAQENSKKTSLDRSHSPARNGPGVTLQTDNASEASRNSKIYNPRKHIKQAAARGAVAVENTNKRLGKRAEVVDQAVDELSLSDLSDIFSVFDSDDELAIGEDDNDELMDSSLPESDTETANDPPIAITGNSLLPTSPGRRKLEPARDNQAAQRSRGDLPKSEKVQTKSPATKRLALDATPAPKPKQKITVSRVRHKGVQVDLGPRFIYQKVTVESTKKPSVPVASFIPSTAESSRKDPIESTQGTRIATPKSSFGPSEQWNRDVQAKIETSAPTMGAWKLPALASRADTGPGENSAHATGGMVGFKLKAKGRLQSMNVGTTSLHSSNGGTTAAGNSRAQRYEGAQSDLVNGVALSNGVPCLLIDEDPRLYGLDSEELVYVDHLAQRRDVFADLRLRAAEVKQVLQEGIEKRDPAVGTTEVQACRREILRPLRHYLTQAQETQSGKMRRNTEKAIETIDRYEENERLLRKEGAGLLWMLGKERIHIDRLSKIANRIRKPALAKAKWALIAALIRRAGIIRDMRSGVQQRRSILLRSSLEELFDKHPESLPLPAIAADNPLNAQYLRRIRENDMAQRYLMNQGTMGMYGNSSLTTMDLSDDGSSRQKRKVAFGGSSAFNSESQGAVDRIVNASSNVVARQTQRNKPVFGSTASSRSIMQPRAPDSKQDVAELLKHLQSSEKGVETAKSLLLLDGGCKSELLDDPEESFRMSDDEAPQSTAQAEKIDDKKIVSLEQTEERRKAAFLLDLRRLFHSADTDGIAERLSDYPLEVTEAMARMPSPDRAKHRPSSRDLYVAWLKDLNHRIRDNSFYLQNRPIEAAEQHKQDMLRQKAVAAHDKRQLPSERGPPALPSINRKRKATDGQNNVSPVPPSMGTSQTARIARPTFGKQ